MNSLFGELFIDFWAVLRFCWTNVWPDFGPGFWPGLGGPADSVQLNWDEEIRCTILPGKRNTTFNSLLFELPEIQNLILGSTKHYSNLTCFLFLSEG